MFPEKPQAILLMKQPNVVRKNAFLYLHSCEEQNCYDELYTYIAEADALMRRAYFLSQDIFP